MNSRKGIQTLLCLLVAVMTLCCAEVQPPKMITLYNGEEVPDLRGYWRVDYVYYGRYQALSGYCHDVKIFQDGNVFTALVKNQDQFFSIGSKIVKGEISSRGLKNVQIWTKDRGWLDCEGAIFNNGNRIVLMEPSQKRTLTKIGTM